MDFTAFDTKKLDEYAAQAKAEWGDTDAYKEFEKKSAGRTPQDESAIAMEMIRLFKEFGEMRDLQPDDASVQAQVKKLQEYITENYYNCTKEILAGLGKAYSAGGEFTTNIDSYGGEGTAEFVDKAIQIYCS